MSVRFSSKLGPLPLVAVLLVAGGGAGLLKNRAPADPARCPPSDASCDAETVSPNGEPAAVPVVPAETVCGNAGYLCAALATGDRIQLRRWKDFSGTMVVHVPRPDFEDGDEAARLQEAAARGLRAWNRQPFEILYDLRGDRDPHLAVQWRQTLPGAQLGIARTQWSRRTGLSVVAIELATRNPHAPGEVNGSRQIQLTAAHEMGHALGLPHSDSERDVMYPTNTATSLSAQDYRTMEVLYRLEDGTEIVR
jgi:predicted Zn-dependent protease